VNPARGVSLPRKGKKEHVHLRHNQVATLSQNCGDKGSLVLTLAYTGLRWGEAVGLRVKDLDTARHRLNVRWNAVRVGGEIVIGTPKSHERRSVPFPEMLSALRTDAAESKQPDHLLFGNGTSLLRTPTTHDGWFVVGVLQAQKIDPALTRITPHDHPTRTPTHRSKSGNFCGR